ncbi:MAG: amidohydrolase family protein [Coriobacteriales bacterium]|jgi:N-acyl-D-amino-acid deacylase|nr:amidohydrolase family protein [Coriobacteriales bacterium]
MYDLAIVGGELIDPERTQPYRANLYCRGGRIAALSEREFPARHRIDAGGCCVSPGFIDIHGHIDGDYTAARLLHLQGVTSVLNGNCGFGLLDVGAWQAKLNQDGFILNQFQLVGHKDLRERIGVSDDHVALSDAQITQAGELLLGELEGGAVGLSFGLEYQPGAGWAEIQALSQVVAHYGGLVSIHLRSDGLEGLDALEEAFEIQRRTGAAVQISHVVYQFCFGWMREALSAIDAAVRAGLDISCDSGMYTAFATYIGTEVFREGCVERWGCDYSDLHAASGRYRGQALNRQTYLELRREAPRDVVIAMLGNDDLPALAFTLPYMMASSDAGVNRSGDASQGHPQDTGTFPRFLRMMVREQGQLSLNDAIRRITLLPAQRLGLPAKGRLELGCDADLVIFDPHTISDTSAFAPKGRVDALSKGIHAIVMGGTISVLDNQLVCDHLGRAG